MVTTDDWVDYMRSVGRSENTIRARVTVVSLICKHCEVDDPTKITRLNVIRFLGRPRQPWTRITYWRGLQAWARFVREFDDPEFDPMKGIERPDIPEGVARPISDEAVIKLLGSPMHWRTRAYVYLALYQGLRVHEIAKLRAEDFDLGSGWMRVVGKRRIEKSIPIHPVVADMVRHTLPLRGWWFPRKDGTGPVQPATVSTIIARQLRRVGIEATAHQLRDTCATRVQRMTHDIRVTQIILRHKSVSSTQKYVAIADADVQAAIDGLSWAALDAA